VRISAPNPITGTEECVYRRIFDENWYYQLCENAHKKEVVSYYKGGSIEE
jgi:hypothetical protein